MCEQQRPPHTSASKRDRERERQRPPAPTPLLPFARGLEQLPPALRRSQNEHNGGVAAAAPRLRASLGDPRRLSESTTAASAQSHRGRKHMWEPCRKQQQQQRTHLSTENTGQPTHRAVF